MESIHITPLVEQPRHPNHSKAKEKFTCSTTLYQSIPFILICFIGKPNLFYIAMTKTTLCDKVCQ